MWKLVLEDGTVVRDGCETQWDALRTAKTRDGKSFKKVEALSLEPGTEVFRQWYDTSTVNSPVLDNEGNLLRYVRRKVRVPRMEKCLLIQY